MHLFVESCCAENRCAYEKASLEKHPGGPPSGTGPLTLFSRSDL
jgi:hypothetical protein